MRCLRRDEGVGGNVGAEARKGGLGRVPDLDGVDVLADELLEVRRQGPAVDLGARARGADALRDVEDDARETVRVDPDFLVVGYLAEFAVVFGKGLSVSCICIYIERAWWVTESLKEGDKRKARDVG